MHSTLRSVLYMCVCVCANGPNHIELYFILYGGMYALQIDVRWMTKDH